MESFFTKMAQVLIGTVVLAAIVLVMFSAYHLVRTVSRPPAAEVRGVLSNAGLMASAPSGVTQEELVP